MKIILLTLIFLSTFLTLVNAQYLGGNGGGNAVATLLSSPLPVELSTFTAISKGSDVKLNWQTATEVNNYGFEIERFALSAERQKWEKIGFVNGNGNSNSPKEYSYIDKNIIGGGNFLYRLKQIDNDGQFEYSKTVEVQLTLSEYALYQNYPNPFNPVTNIRYQLPKESKILIKIYNILGSEVIELLNDKKEPGIYEINFNASNLPSGIYFYQISTPEYSNTKKMILLK